MVEKKKLSIKERVAQHKSNKGNFCCVMGARLGGKTTLAGTLKEPTLLLQAARLETNSKSALKLASENGYKLDVISFSSLDELAEIFEEFKESKEYKNLYIDSLSAIGDLVYDRPDIQKLLNKDVWQGYRTLGSEIVNFILKCKDFVDNSDKNVFLTLALKEKTDNQGFVTKLDLIMKGNMSLEMLQKVCPNIICLFREEDEECNSIRKMAIRSHDVYNSRIDGILDSCEKIPAVVTPDLELFLKVANSVK